MSCENCGRGDGHWLGCEAAPSGTEQSPVPPEGGSAGGSLPPECAKDGCTQPRAASKGPRPAKYCDKHKTGSKK